ncbi:MAG TPA: methyltransferase domain-containing protein [Candidatus Methylomirabilis sp.]|nr:methyltransferase domain-containing protein [Candidatus Methylomirabilis sp.]
MKKLMLNLGCWKRNLPGFTNVDICDLPHIHHKTGIDDLSMFENETVDLIYSSHSFEYFDRQEAKKVLAEWKRVLKPNATLRLAVPDFDKLLEVYKMTGKLEKILGPLFGRMEVQTAAGPKILYHKTVYNFDDLEQLLTENGFKNVRRYDWRQTIHKDFDDHSQAYFPHMDKEKGLLISLNVEAEKI